MKIRGSILWLVVVAAALIALLLWFGKKEPEKTTFTTTVKTNAVSPATMGSSPPGTAPVRANTPTTTLITKTASATVTPTPLPQSKVEREMGVLSNYNDIPIAFYGELEDQFSNAVANAVVNFSVQVINGQESTTERGQVASDANGLFTISGYKGQNLDITPHKAGYVLAATDTLFWYSHLEAHPYSPDAYNPTIIRMWKLQGAQPLVGINKTFKLPYTGEPIFFDLLTGKVVSAGGDLEVIVTRAPGVITQRNHGDWSIKFVPVNGGILESDYHTAQVTFEAPASGYQDSYFVKMQSDEPGWYDNIQKEFFLTSRNGQVYSKFSFDFGINDNPSGTMWFQFKGVASTNGSRNWEATVPQ